ncbi:MAG: hypothetical protein NTZ25_02240 [Candidatus Peregrinibacteria bacterium]|nr:hypothetical protein [Candidatus Peregrinibacteria bacterium]
MNTPCILSVLPQKLSSGATPKNADIANEKSHANTKIKTYLLKEKDIFLPEFMMKYKIAKEIPRIRKTCFGIS